MYINTRAFSPSRTYVIHNIKEDVIEAHKFILPEITPYNEVLENTCNQATWYYYHWLDDEADELYGAIPIEDYVNIKIV